MELEVIIGLEIHAEMNTRTKMFCGCDNDNFAKEPNTNVCPICMGFPGMLPAANEESIKKGVIAALALNCEIKKHSKFDRKNYFYPDLPSGYQISQFDEPVSEHGHLEILVKGQRKRIGITRLHLENDAGKLSHSTQGTLLDFNRAGKPLMEIVSDHQKTKNTLSRCRKLCATAAAATATWKRDKCVSTPAFPYDRWGTANSILEQKSKTSTPSVLSNPPSNARSPSSVNSGKPAHLRPLRPPSVGMSSRAKPT